MIKFNLICCCCSVAQLCPVFCEPMHCSTPGFPVLHHLPEFAQTHICWIGDTIQPSHPLSSPPPAFSLFQHQGLDWWVSFFVFFFNKETSEKTNRDFLVLIAGRYYNLREGIWLNDRTLEILNSHGSSTGLSLLSSLWSASFDPEPLRTSHILYLSFPAVF